MRRNSGATMIASMKTPAGSECVTATPEASAVAAASHQKPRPVCTHLMPVHAISAPNRVAADSGLAIVP